MPRPFVTLALIVAGCTQPESPVRSTAPLPPSTASLAAPAPSASATAQAPAVEAPPLSSATPGPAYVLVDHSGVLQITEEGATTVFPIPRENSSLFTEIAVSPTGHLWLTDFQGIRVRAPQGQVSSNRTVKDGPLYEKLIIRSDRDAWAVTSDIEWNIVHYDGVAWKSIRKRGQFPGKYDDNKFSGLAMTTEGVWVSSWNGLWRGVGEQWEKMTLPEGVTAGPELLVYRDQLIVAGPGSVFMRKGGNWVKLVWPDKILLRWAITDHGFFAIPHGDKPRVWIGPVEGSTPAIESDPVMGHHIRVLEFDGSGRIWVGTDQAIAVLDRRGHMLMQWPAGTLDGLTGSVLDLAVVGAGPVHLPSPKPGRLWNVTGRFVTYKSRSPLSGATIFLCSWGMSHCANAPGIKRATTDAQGVFRLSGVPEGQFWLEVQPSAGTKDCESPFTETGESLLPARDCHEAPGAPGVCDLGPRRTCLPFEMPPPPPPR